MSATHVDTVEPVSGFITDINAFARQIGRYYGNESKISISEIEVIIVSKNKSHLCDNRVQIVTTTWMNVRILPVRIWAVKMERHV